MSSAIDLNKSILKGAKYRPKGSVDETIFPDGFNPEDVDHGLVVGPPLHEE